MLLHVDFEKTLKKVRAKIFSVKRAIALITELRVMQFKDSYE